MVEYPPFGSGTPFVRIKDDAVDVASAGDTDFVFAKGDSVKNTGGSNLVFEKDVGVDVDTRTLTIQIIQQGFNVIYPDLNQSQQTDGFNVIYPNLDTSQSTDGFNVIYPSLDTSQLTEGFNVQYLTGLDSQITDGFNK